MRSINRRNFLRALATVPAVPGLFHYEALAAPEIGRVKIRDIKTMMIQGPRTYTLVKVETDSGLYGIGEGYGSPGVGVKEQILALKPDLVGKDPLEIGAIYTGLGTRTDGSAHSLMRAVSGIEIALWDLAGKIIGLPVTTLLGGKFRDSVRMYYDSGPRDMFDRASCREWADMVKSDPGGWTAFKIHFTGGLGLKNPDPSRDAANRLLTSIELGRIRTAFEKRQGGARLEA
jgi:L-alanine-DL-glutamate epimerase-like enolase superfamily enzyme